MVAVAPEWQPPEAFEEYRLVRLLGRGAMGQVFLAHDTLLDRLVAVKFVRAAGDPTARARFFVEARAIARLQHPNVVAVYRVAEVSRHPFLVSEYVRGRPLDKLDRPVPWREGLELALDLARGLAAAHRCGVLHRDLKPANAILADDGRAKLLDFGLAEVVGNRPAYELELAAAPQASGDSADLLIDANATRSSPGRSPAAHASGSPSSSGVHWVGTPLYMAPEVWRGEPATPRSDLYSLGILLYELLAGTAPYRGVPFEELEQVVQERDIAPLADVAPNVGPALAAIVDRLVAREAGERFTSVEALIVALEEQAHPASETELPDGNPYRGLAAFEASHRSLFFGRRGEIRELADRVTTEPFVVVGGDSGVGKSSLCRAGVLPWLAEKHGWSCVDVIPAHQPVRALAAALAVWTGTDEAELTRRLRDDPDGVARSIRQHTADSDRPNRRLLLFVDQLEELLTLSKPGDARAIAAAIAALTVRTPSIRVLATARSDFLSRLAALPGLGDEMARGLYFLRPLTGERIREVIVRPAAAKGVAFASEQLVDTLVEQAELAPGGLPLLQFTLAELWDARDVAGRTIRAETLTALGGVEGALTRHADRILASLQPSERDAAHRCLLRLITAEGTRARRTEAQLVTDGSGGAAERSALEALVRGRLVVAKDERDGATYEIAHEALLTSWPTLQGWLQRGVADRAVRGRVERAAAEWERLGRSREALWGRRQLAETSELDRSTMGPRERAFLDAARAGIVRRILLAVGLSLVVAIGVIAIAMTIETASEREREALIIDHLGKATSAIDGARQAAKERDAARTRAFELFTSYRWKEGEETWAHVEAVATQEEDLYRIGSSNLEIALSIDPSRSSLRQLFADITVERLVRAERDRHRELAQELTARLAAYDDGDRAAKLAAESRLDLEIEPAGTKVWSHRAGSPRRDHGAAPLAPILLPAGSVALFFEAPGHAPTALPLRVSAGQHHRIRVALPPSSSAPRDMIYVPPGSFLFGSAESSDLRHGFLNAPPLHEVAIDGYFIARHEVTFAEWIEFLDDLAPEERRRRTPGTSSPGISMSLTEVGPKRWRLTFGVGSVVYQAESGEQLRYQERAHRASQDWTKFPVAAVSYEDSVAFAAWLDRTGRIPGARLCDEYEWERAARGTDARRFPSGDKLAADDANFDITYGRAPGGFGPDEVGSHPASRSPVGVDDMAGNVWEWTRSVQAPDAPVARGGGWYNAELSSRSMNREYGEPTQRHPLMGLRLCASAPR